MKIDLTLPLNIEVVKKANGAERKTLNGHIGTHFDVMNKIFPLEYSERNGIVFDVSNIENRDIELSDIDIDSVNENMFVGFCTKFIEKYEYGSDTYFHNHPQLSKELINKLLEKKISIIGIDFAGVRGHIEHTVTDQLCADNGIFVIENLVNLKELVNTKPVIHIYPMNYTDSSGLPCRVIADI